MVPLARALATAGHEIAFATAEEFRSHIERTGFSTFPAGLGMAMQMREARVRYPGFHPREHVFSTPDLEFTLTRIWAGIGAPARLEDLRSIVAGWVPQLMIHDNRELAGPIAAAEAGLPYVNHGVGASFPLDLYGRVAAATAWMWEAQGIDPGPLGGPSLAWPDVRELDVAQPMRPVPFDTVAHDQLPPWAGGLGRRPVVYITQGTTFNRDTAVFGPLLDALRNEAVDIIVTVGEDRDPAALGPQPENVRVERYLAQSLLFPLCDLVVTHGGGGTTLAALTHGIPLLIVPQGGDQFLTAERACAAGVARSVSKCDLEPERLRGEVRLLLDDRAYRERARDLQQEIRDMPAPDDFVEVLEQLARTREPVSTALSPLGTSGWRRPGAPRCTDWELIHQGVATLSSPWRGEADRGVMTGGKQVDGEGPRLARLRNEILATELTSWRMGTTGCGRWWECSRAGAGGSCLLQQRESLLAPSLLAPKPARHTRASASISGRVTLDGALPVATRGLGI
ncbi:MAG: glycosyltransferase [Actinomycetota bacterium]|nr:glycosyltransferase [Actinomycetota bacterium]